MPLRCIVLFVALLAAGCGDGRPPVYPAGGKVTVKGEPAAGALVVFHPRDPGRENDPKPVATVRDDGTFTLTTFAAEDGAPAGEYGITVVWNQKAKEKKFSLGDEGGGAGQDRLGGRYGDPRKPQITVTVTASGPNDFDLKLD
jgi:hypothetical protein